MGVLNWALFEQLPTNENGAVKLSQREAAFILSALEEIENAWNWVATPPEFDGISAQLNYLMSKLAMRNAKLNEYGIYTIESDLIIGEALSYVTVDETEKNASSFSYYSPGSSFYINEAGWYKATFQTCLAFVSNAYMLEVRAVPSGAANSPRWKSERVTTAAGNYVSMTHSPVLWFQAGVGYLDFQWRLVNVGTAGLTVTLATYSPNRILLERIDD